MRISVIVTQLAHVQLIKVQLFCTHIVNKN
jgi:hypothetical protein